ncbi:uncharacterized protein LOC142564832 [Dermacentor variabilis]|uniref:uncharacterized protein LOC142564832 n=1 Tax=Dermacentor variabilis TaxID=34621 RepID=UPI003F5C9DE6
MMAQWHMGIATWLGVTFLLGSSLLGTSSSCNTQLPPLGPRLLSAKAFFGKVMQVCSKEILAYARTIRHDKLHTILHMVCDNYKVCKAFARKGVPKPMYDCILKALDKQSSHLTRLHISEAYNETSREALECLQEIQRSIPLDIQAMEDAVAVARQAILTFGWT